VADPEIVSAPLLLITNTQWTTPCPKKPSRFLFVRTSSNFHRFW